MKELEHLRAQNKILRKLLQSFIEATDPSAENGALSTEKSMRVRKMTIEMLKRIDDFKIRKDTADHSDT